MDKQIIIDETKCPWFNDGSCDLFYSDKEECWYRKCKDTPNCYYRETQTQLKAKEQECERLKEEQEEVKKYLGISHKTILERLEELTEFRDRDRDEIWQLNQTLAEIKEICNNNDELKGDFNLVDCDKYKLGKHNLANKILQKISEVMPNGKA